VLAFHHSKRKQAPKFLSKLNNKTKLPMRSIVTTYILVVAIIILANFYALKNFGACFSSLKEKSILLVVYIPEFAADSNDVRMYLKVHLL
jgi:amino acid transporter